MKLRQVILNATVGCVFNCPGCYINDGNHVEIAYKAFETYYKMLEYYKILETNILINVGLTKSKMEVLFNEINKLVKVSDSKIDLLFPISLYFTELKDLIYESQIPFWVSTDVYKHSDLFDTQLFDALNENELFLGYNIYIWDKISFQYFLNFVDMYKNKNYKHTISVVFRKDKHCITEQYFKYAKYIEDNFNNIDIHLDCYSTGCVAGNWISILSDGRLSLCPIITDYAFDFNKLDNELSNLKRNKYSSICINK